MLKYNWMLKVNGQEHNIQLQMDTALGLFGTGSGRLMVDEKTVHRWGCNPFRMIPKGSYAFEVDGKGVSVKSKFSAAGLFFLVLDGKEIPPIQRKEGSLKTGRKR